ncbi:aminotransferase class IV [Hyphomonas pacifica]|nr:aminotransferase class IV [Hyphomonas pacifica]
MPIGDQVHLNGQIVPLSEAYISPLDRGFLFAHAAYEVTAVYNGKFVDLDGHLLRLRRTLDGIALPNPHSDADWTRIHQELIDANGINEGLVYLQVTGGAYEARDYTGPDTFEPTIFMYADTKPLIGQGPSEVSLRSSCMTHAGPVVT